MFIRLLLTVLATIIILDQNNTTDRVVRVSYKEVLTYTEQASTNLATIKKAKGRTYTTTSQ